MPGSSRKKWKAFESLEVASVFDSYPRGIRTKMMDLRQLIFDTAAATEGVGELEETLRWGEPSYLTMKSKSGSIIRIHSKEPDEYAIFFHCQTDLVDRFKKLYPDQFRYRGNRSITFDKQESVPERELGHCISSALTYHLDKRRTPVEGPRRRLRRTGHP